MTLRATSMPRPWIRTAIAVLVAAAALLGPAAGAHAYPLGPHDWGGGWASTGTGAKHPFVASAATVSILGGEGGPYATIFAANSRCTTVAPLRVKVHTTADRALDVRRYTWSGTRRIRLAGRRSALRIRLSVGGTATAPTLTGTLRLSGRIRTSAKRTVTCRARFPVTVRRPPFAFDQNLGEPDDISPSEPYATDRTIVRSGQVHQNGSIETSGAFVLQPRRDGYFNAMWETTARCLNDGIEGVYGDTDDFQAIRVLHSTGRFRIPASGRFHHQDQVRVKRKGRRYVETVRINGTLDAQGHVAGTVSWKTRSSRRGYFTRRCDDKVRYDAYPG